MDLERLPIPCSKPGVPMVDCFWVNFGGSCNGISWYILWTFDLFYGHLICICLLWPFGIFCGNVAYFPHFLYIAPRKIWQPSSKRLTFGERFMHYIQRFMHTETLTTSCQTIFRTRTRTCINGQINGRLHHIITLSFRRYVNLKIIGAQIMRNPCVLLYH
jgi:hypothetical protein